MQRYTFRQLAATVLSATPLDLTTHEECPVHNLIKVENSNTASIVKTGTPRPISATDRMRTNVPMGIALASTNQESEKLSFSDDDANGDIVHEESVAPRIQSPRRKSNHKGPVARKDDWPDSSDDDLDLTPKVPINLVASEYFQTTKSTTQRKEPPRKKTKTATKDLRYHKISDWKKSEVKQAAVKSLSESKTAVDFRERREQEKSYKDKVCAFIDNDILETVDAEGGITPNGRFYKAVHQMMMRSTQKKTMTSTLDLRQEVAQLRAENILLKQAIVNARQALGPL